MYLLRLHRSRRQTRTNGPNRLISQHCFGKSINTGNTNNRLDLLSDSFDSPALLTLLQGFAHTQHRHQASLLSRNKFCCHLLVRLCLQLTPFGMPNEHHATTNIFQLCSRSFASHRAKSCLYSAVLGANHNILQGTNSTLQIQSSRKHCNIHSCWQLHGAKGFQQCSNFLHVAVHFPVSSYQWTTHNQSCASKWVQILLKPAPACK